MFEANYINTFARIESLCTFRVGLIIVIIITITIIIIRRIHGASKVTIIPIVVLLEAYREVQRPGLAS